MTKNKKQKSAIRWLAPSYYIFYNTYRDWSHVEVRGILSNAYKLRRRSKKETDATVACVDEVKKTVDSFEEKKIWRF